MKQYRVLFGFMRGRRGDVIEVPDEHAPGLIAAGLLAPVREGTAEARETRTVTPEIKEGGAGSDATERKRPGRKPRGSTDG